MVTLDLGRRIECMDNQICPDIVYRLGNDVDKAISIYRCIGSVRDSVERNVTEEYRKDELTDKLDTIYFKWIGELNRMGDGIDDETLRLIERDVDHEKLERDIMNPPGRNQYLEVNYRNSFGNGPLRNDDELVSPTPIPLQIEGNYNSGNRDSDFPENSAEDRRSYLECSPSSRQIARGIEFLEKHGHLNPEASLKRLEKLESELHLESDEWVRGELEESLYLLRNSFLN